MENMDKGQKVLIKITELINWPKIPQMPQNPLRKSNHFIVKVKLCLYETMFSFVWVIDDEHLEFLKLNTT